MYFFILLLAPTSTDDDFFRDTVLSQIKKDKIGATKQMKSFISKYF